jgi:hypothetical protein
MSKFYVGRPCKHGHDGLRYASTNGCVHCTKARANAIPYGTRKSAARKSELKRKYGITEAEYFDMLDKQQGKCAICECEPQGKDFAVDHNHKTGEVRGLLCSNCNTGIGLLGDDVSRLIAARQYLINYQSTTVQA